MPSQLQGFNKDGESKWFTGNSLPEGWSITDPNLVSKEAIPEQPKEKPKAKAKAKKKAEDKPSREPEAAE